MPSKKYFIQYLFKSLFLLLSSGDIKVTCIQIFIGKLLPLVLKTSIYSLIFSKLVTKFLKNNKILVFDFISLTFFSIEFPKILLSLSILSSLVSLSGGILFFNLTNSSIVTSFFSVLSFSFLRI